MQVSSRNRRTQVGRIGDFILPLQRYMNKKNSLRAARPYTNHAMPNNQPRKFSLQFCFHFPETPACVPRRRSSSRRFGT
jgi:hypothetical protein